MRPSQAPSSSDRDPRQIKFLCSSSRQRLTGSTDDLVVRCRRLVFWLAPVVSRRALGEHRWWTRSMPAGAFAAACATGGRAASCPWSPATAASAAARTATSPPTPPRRRRHSSWSRQRACAGTAPRPGSGAAFAAPAAASLFWERVEGSRISVAAGTLDPANRDRHDWPHLRRRRWRLLRGSRTTCPASPARIKVRSTAT